MTDPEEEELREEWDETPAGTGRGGTLGTPDFGDPPDELQPERDPGQPPEGAESDVEQPD